MKDQVWTERSTADADSVPLLAFAIHDGHGARGEVEERFALSDAERLREEDPFTSVWTAVAPVQWIGLRSRFEVDLNRPREKSVYQQPEDAWGLQVWKDGIPSDVVQRSLSQYDAFYAAAEQLLRERIARFGRVVIYDLHTYNHRREGPDGPHADPAGNPQVNIGTGTMDRDRWAPVVDRFMSDLSGHDFPGGRLDVRENVKFRGGNFCRWVHATFPDSVCSIAIEFKKFFMDEWTGEPDQHLVQSIEEALRVTTSGVVDALRGMD